MLESKIMKKLLVIIFLSLYFIIPSQADDIRDIEIEGMSIGESLLKHLSKEEIKKSYKLDVYKDKSFTHAQVTKTSSEYDRISVFYKSKDQKYIIEGVVGENTFNNFKDCSKKQSEVIKSISSIVSTKGIKNNKVHGVDKTGKSKVIQTSFKLNGGNLNISCYKYAGDFKAKFKTPLNVSLTSTDLLFWLRNKAYR